MTFPESGEKTVPALPEVERRLHVALTDVAWLVISFLLNITLSATRGGRRQKS